MGNSQGKPVEFDGEGVFYLPRPVIPAIHPRQFTAFVPAVRWLMDHRWSRQY